jgi:hypothetical protein
MDQEIFEEDFFNEDLDYKETKSFDHEQLSYPGMTGQILELTPEDINVIFPWPGLLRKKAEN